MSTYAKLFSSIVHSTIWREANHVRIVWITMLALKDRGGIVEASVPGLADAARVTLSECKAALLLLSSPDEYSRTPDNEGRRIAEVPGGWSILNHEVYRERDSFDHRRASDAERARRYRERMATTEIPTSRDDTESVTEKRDENGDNRDASRTVTARHTESRLVTTSDTDTEADTNQNKPESKSARGDRKKPPVPPPDEFVPNQTTLRSAERYGRNWEDDWTACRDHHLSRGTPVRDWQATLRTWFAKSKEFARQPIGTTCPEKIEFTEAHRGVAKRGVIDVVLEWRIFSKKNQASGRRQNDWAAAFESHLAECVSRIERSAAYRANGPQGPTPGRGGVCGAPLAPPGPPVTPPDSEPRQKRNLGELLKGIG